MMASAGQHKISPRKFSEKIALLNKKEAEGNAEFEEIIKEVQATRSVSSVRVGSGQQRGRAYDKNNEELEEVFESLIKCVGQYEQELQDSQPSGYNTPDSSSLIGVCRQSVISHDDCGRPTSADISAATTANRLDANSTGNLNNAATIQPPNQMPLNRLDPINYLALGTSGNEARISSAPYCIARGGDLEATKCNIVSENQSHLYGWPCQQDDPYNNNNNNHHHHHHHHSNQQQLPPSQMRTRVTSIGSLNYRNLCSNYNQIAPRCQCQDGNWVACQEMYLGPVCDKGPWHKSSSDSALHVPSQSGACELQNRPPCSENPLAMEVEVYNSDQGFQIPANDPNRLGMQVVDARSQLSTSAAMEEQRCDNSCAVQPGTGYMDSARIANFGETSFEQPAYHLIDAPKTTGNSNKSNTGQVGQIPGEARCYHVGVSGQIESQTTLVQQQQADISYQPQTELVIGDVPGINICMIEDDGDALPAQLKLEDNQKTCFSRDSSLPDLSNLQFSNNEENGSRQTEVNKPGSSVANDFSHFQQIISNSPAYNNNVLAQDWQPIQEQQKLATSETDIAANEQVDFSISSCELGGPGNWQPMAANRGAYCELAKIDHNLLSGSERGLQTNLDYDGLQAHQEQQVGNNIIRSHSHNSIDHYASKYKLSYNQGNLFHAQPVPPQHNHSLSNQRHQQYHQYKLGQYPPRDRAPTERKFLEKYVSDSSMRPLHGSTSPIDPSSNLTSPQSERSSPATIASEINETSLPYLSGCQPPDSIHQRTSEELFGDNINNTVYESSNIR